MLPASDLVDNWADEARKRKVDLPQANSNSMEIYFRTFDSDSLPNVKIKDMNNNEFLSLNTDSNKIENSTHILSIGGALETGGKGDLLGLYIDLPKSDYYTIEFNSDDKGKNKSIFSTMDNFSIDLNWVQEDTVGKQILKVNMVNNEAVLTGIGIKANDNFTFLKKDGSNNQTNVYVNNLLIQDNDSVKAKIFNNGNSFYIQNFGSSKTYSIKFDNLIDSLSCTNVKFSNDKEIHIYTVDKWDSLGISDVLLEIDKDGDSTIDSVIHLRQSSIVITSQPQSQEICSADSVILNVEADYLDGSINDIEYSWYKDDSELVDDTIYSGVKTNRLKINNISKINEGYFKAQIKLSSTPINKFTDNAFVRVKELPFIYYNTPSLINLESGSLLEIKVSAGSDQPITFQWYKDSIAIPNQTDSIFRIINVKPEDQGRYYCRISNDCGSRYSYETLVKVLIPNSIEWQNEITKYFDIELQPNPSDNIVNVIFKLRKNSSAKIDLVDVSGDIIKNIVNKNLFAGEYHFLISKDELHISNGNYFVVVNLENVKDFKKLLYLK
jgi:hypothetical protein